MQASLQQESPQIFKAFFKYQYIIFCTLAVYMLTGRQPVSMRLHLYILWLNAAVSFTLFLPEIFHRCLEHLIVIFSRHVLVKIASSSFGVAHLS